MFKKSIAALLCFVVSSSMAIFAEETELKKEENKIVIPEREERVSPPKSVEDSTFMTHDSLANDTVSIIGNAVASDSISAHAYAVADSLAADSVAVNKMPAEFEHRKMFNPDPTRAVWLSALCPGLGQIYNRRYWKLPIVIGGYVGLTYATSWNNRMLTDYTQAYRDIMDSDPNTKSYMDFYPPTTTEDDIDMDWLKRSLKSKKDFYRRNRDLCIIGMVGLYLICMVDAYVDASLSHFDISPDLSMDIAPAVINPGSGSANSFGVHCALTF